MRNSDGGFTLFEVLGAVAILAIVYTTLSTSAIWGLRSEGESRRMLEASLIADWELNEYEIGLEAGEAPIIGILEGEEQDGFTVSWEITPLQTPIFSNASKNDPDDQAQNPVGINAPGQPVQSATTEEGAAVFFRIMLKVSWFEAGNERSVTRTIFATDEDAAAKYAAENVLNQGAAEDSHL